MCGIVGYIGEKQAAPILLSGLDKLEYRGYDSSGIAVVEKGEIYAPKYCGRLSVLKENIRGGENLKSTIGIGHTRWATHGEPSDINSHPHLSENREFAVVHNGIIENYISLKEELIKDGVTFKSETDSEVIAHLLMKNFNGNMVEGICKAIEKLRGSYALGIIYKGEPDKIYGVKKDSPLVIGKGKKENYIGSDIIAFSDYTKEFYFLEDNEIAVVSSGNIKFYNNKAETIIKQPSIACENMQSPQKNGYSHFMLKEINEQQKAVCDTIIPLINEGEINFNINLEKFNNIKIVACGSAYHVGALGKYIIEKLAKIPVESEIASEFRYKESIIDKNTLFIAVSQSGETADTLAALREAKKRGAKTLAIVNSPESSIARESDKVITTYGGREISVATTKAFSAQLAVIYLLALKLADIRNTISKKEYSKYINELKGLPEEIGFVVLSGEKIKEFAKKIKDEKSIFYMGRNLDYGVAMEGSLKLKEISYIHSEAYAAGELKHGSVALIEDGTVVIALVTQTSIREKTISNIKEVKARGAYVFAVANQGDSEIKEIVDFVYYIPKCADIFSPSLAIIPLQLLAYYVALEKGCDIDKPRNLAKSVTVE